MTHVETGHIVLEAKNLVKKYNILQENEFEALHGINFQAERGEFICVMGPSGSGKSTFINSISTIDFPTSGTVTIEGAEIHTMTSNQLGKFRNEKLGFVFQDFNLLDTHTVYENVALPLSLSHVKKDEIRHRVGAMAERMNVKEILSKYPDECSGGQRQRAAICRALIANPSILIADEPTGNLDSKNSMEFLSMITRLNREQGVTIIMVTHDALIASYSSRMIYIRDGKIEETIERGELEQKEYFEKISELNTRESRGMLA